MKILILIDSLGIGGAETHVETLAGTLVAAGHGVVVASSGGGIVEKMKKAGIKHLLLPNITSKKHYQNEKNEPLSLRLSAAREVICRYIERERPDIVHAHTRRTAILASKICKRYNLPLVTTAHALFSMNFPKNILSEWGDGTIAVSEDIKNHLIERSQAAPERICVIENGVNVPRENKICGDKAHDLPNQSEDCCKNSRKIVFVSRLDEDCSMGAHLLCEVAPRLAEKYDDLQIIIVGGGTEYTKILQKSQQINSKINRELIKTVGSAKDTAVYFQEGALFVGVSRAALEAMAYKMAVILLGDEGYLGLLNKQKLSPAKMSNFTCRGALSLPTQGEFFDEICRFFDMSDDERKRTCEFSREVVKNGYSAEQMGQKTLDFYQNLINQLKNEGGAPTFPAKKVVLCGYYGNGNFGDEAILSVLRERITTFSPKAEIYVLQGKNLAKNAKIMKNADLFVFGGGSLLQNSTSNASLFYYLSIISLGKSLCKRSIMLSNGIGPINDGKISRKVLLKMIARVVDSFDFVSVRDSASRKLLSEALPDRKIHLVPDPTLINHPKINRRLNKKEKTVNEKEDYFIFNPCLRGLRRCGEINISALADTLAQIENEFGARAKILVLNEKEDSEMALKLSRGLDGAKIIVPKIQRELIEVLSGAKFGIFQRYHGALFSALCNIPVVAISDDPKMQSLCDDIIGGGAYNATILKNSAETCEIIEQKVKNFEKNRAILSSKIEKYSHLASRSLDTVLTYFL